MRSDERRGSTPTRDDAVAVPPRRSLLRRVLEPLVVAAFVGFAAWAVVRQWDGVRDVLGELSVQAIGLASLAALVGTWCTFMCWRELLADFGSRVPLTGAMRVFFVGQVGKYLPGKVWPILTQARLGRAYGVPGRASAAAALVLMGMLLGTGLLVAVGTFPVLGTGSFGAYWWTLLALPVALVALLPPVLNRGLALMLRLARREPMPRPLELAEIARSAGWAVAMWACFGVHLWALLSDLGTDAPYLLWRAIGAFAGSWAIGLLLLIAPAGIGPRETALVLILGTTVAQPVALVAAVVSRLLMTLADLIWPVIAMLVERRRVRRASPPTGHG